eukprot:PhF_6_TR25532/c4_g1_i5/m.35762
MHTLPFHCKEVGTINKEALTKLAHDPNVPQSNRTRLEELWKYVSDETMYKEMEPQDIDKSEPTELTTDDLEAKLKVGQQLIKIDRAQVKSVSKQFCVTETKMKLKGIGEQV